MAFQDRNGTCGMKPEHSGRNLAEKSGTDRDLKWDENCFVLFYFLNWYKIFWPFQMKRNGIDNLHSAYMHVKHDNSKKKKNKSKFYPFYIQFFVWHPSISKK